MRIAVVGSGISGLTAAHVLAPHHDVTLFEAAPRLGGHVNTVEVRDGERSHHVDVGFVVYNEATYPNFVRLLDELGVDTQPSDMTFSVSGAHVEYGGTGLRGVFAEPSNALRPSFHRLLWDVSRFNQLATVIADRGADDRTVAEFLDAERFGRRFAAQFLLPLGSAVWSVDPDRFAAMPIHTLALFLHRHEFLRVRGRPTWRAITGGAARYVEALVQRWPFAVHTSTEVHRVERTSGTARVVLQDGHFEADRVVLAVPAAAALGLLEVSTTAEREVLGAFSVTDNDVTLHHDVRMMPSHRRAWASWNYLGGVVPGALPTVTYWMNRLQRIESSRPLLVTLNRHADIDPALVLGQWQMQHPVLDRGALVAQARQHELNSAGPVLFCGAYWGSGFHEDGITSALEACSTLTRAAEVAA